MRGHPVGRLMLYATATVGYALGFATPEVGQLMSGILAGFLGLLTIMQAAELLTSRRSGR